MTKRETKNSTTNVVVSTETFTYDAAGNITGGSADTTFVYDTNNRLISFNGNSVSYDLDGNMLSNGSLTCTYDSANRLISAGGHTYTYNAEDVRIRNLCTEEDTTYTYNTNAKLSMLLMKTTNGVVTKYVYGKGLIGEEVGSVFKTYHFDCRGSTIAITDASGNITDTFAYDTYGKLISRTGTNKVIFGYNGRDGVVTDDNGLIYMRARYYSPEMKRFINADIVAGGISNAITLNRFAYANGNPVSNIDPFGLMSEAAYRRKAGLDEERMHGSQTKSSAAVSQNRSASYYEKKLTLDEQRFAPNTLIPTALEATYMARHIYSATTQMYDKDLDSFFNGWKLKEIYDPGAKDIGLKIGVYYRQVGDEISYCLVYAGTNMEIFDVFNSPSDYYEKNGFWGTLKDIADTISDWKNNIQQPFGNSKDQKQGINFAKKFLKEHPDSYITMVGHSKGGAEAAAAAVATNSDSILFNPASVSLDMYGLNVEDYSADMDVYVVEGEILNNIFGWISTPIDDFEYIYYDGSAIDKHSMNAIISALQ